MIIIHGKDAAQSCYFDASNQPNLKVQMGKVVLLPGQRSPKEGFARHKQDEYSYMIAGSAHTVLESGEDLIGSAGDAQMILAGEAHYNYNDSDRPAEVVWMLVERE